MPQFRTLFSRDTRARPPAIVGHRGAPREAPENTLEGFQAAARAGAAWVKMMTYALGRGIEYYDRPVVDRLVSELAAKEYKFSALVTEIAKSDAFRKRRGADTEE